MEGMSYEGEKPVDLDQLRARLQKMSNQELREFGKAAAYMCTPKVNFGKPPRQEFVLQLEEARTEWKRRHPAGRQHPKASADV